MKGNRVASLTLDCNNSTSRLNDDQISRHDDVAVVHILDDGKVVLEGTSGGFPDPIAGIDFSTSSIRRCHRLE